MTSLTAPISDVSLLIRHAREISSFMDEEAEDALLNGREISIDPDAQIRIQARVVDIVGRRTKEASWIPRPSSRILRRLFTPRPVRLSRQSVTRLANVPYARFAAVAMFVLLAPLAGHEVSGLTSDSSVPGSIKHVVIIKENHSFDNLYGQSLDLIAGPTQGAVDAGKMNGFYGTDSGHGGYQVADTSPEKSQSSGSAGNDIIQTDDLTIQVAQKHAAVSAAEVATLAANHFGTVVSQSRSGGNASVIIVVTVPASQFQPVLRRIYGLGRVTYEDLAAQNVSLREVNLGAQLQNYQSQRLVLLALFNRAKNVAATIHVQQVLSNVQSQIDQLQAQIRYLNRQTAMSTITVAFVTRPARATKTRQSRTTSGPLARAFTDAGTAATNVFTGLIVLLGYTLPILVIGGALYLIAGWLRRRASLPGRAS